MGFGAGSVRIRRCRFFVCSAVAVVLAGITMGGTLVNAQQTTVGVPQQVLSDSFYEQIGLQWGFVKRYPGGGGFFFNNGGGPVIPPFGGFDPNAGARGGFAVGGNGGGFGLGFSASQGNTRSMTTTAPIITMPSGGIGSIQSGQIVPFVTGIVPVVGDGTGVAGTATHPLTERLERLQGGEQAGPRHYVARRAPSAASSTSLGDGERSDESPSSTGGGGGTDSASSSAQRGALSVKELRRQRELAERSAAAERADLRARGEAAADEGKFGVARVYFQQALRSAPEDEAREITARLKRLRESAK